MRRGIIGAVVAMSLAWFAAGCGSSKPPVEASKSTRPQSEQQAAPVQKSTTTTAPGPKMKRTPECIAYSRFGMGQLGVSLATNENRLARVQLFDKVSEGLKQKLPQMTEAINNVNSYVKKLSEDANRVTNAEKEKGQQGLRDLSAWYQASCVEKP